MLGMSTVENRNVTQMSILLILPDDYAHSDILCFHCTDFLDFKRENIVTTTGELPRGFEPDFVYSATGYYDDRLEQLSDLKDVYFIKENVSC